jgi:diaminohydroxyphosphoribosylaminopyrimidine deaminase/5-amino-6-(5-phosphoribosylamino)uracil reductase
VWREDGARRFWVLAEGSKPATPPGVEVIKVRQSADGHLDLSAVLAALGPHQVNEVFVEAGAQLAGAMLQAGVVDEMLLYLSPTLLGHAARPLAILPGLDRLADRLQFRVNELRPIGPDLRLGLSPLPVPVAA